MVLLISSSQLFAQKSNVFLKGMVRDSLNLIKDVHVINLNTLKGTYSVILFSFKSFVIILTPDS